METHIMLCQDGFVQTLAVGAVQIKARVSRQWQAAAGNRLDRQVIRHSCDS